MAKATTKKNNIKSHKTPRMQHAFRGIRDPVVNNASVSTGVLSTIALDANGGYSNNQTIAPLGVIAPVLSANASTGVISVTPATIQGPKHPWLYNQARNFERFRITRYVLVFVGNVGSTTTGQLMLDSSTDAADLTTSQGLSTSTGGKIFDLASSSSKELRFNCDVDSSWKKVSALTYFSSGNAQILTSSTMNDLSVTNWFVTIVGGTPNTSNVGSLYAEYDVEFKEPISYGVNV